MNLVSLMEISKIVYGSKDLFCMFQEYELDERLDRELLNKRIISYLGTNTPLYTTCPTFKGFLEAFFLDHSEQITKLVDTLYFEYNPIWNRDGTEKRTITTSRKVEHERESENADTTKHTGTDTNTDVGTNTGSVSADNVSTWQNDTRTATDNTNTRTANLTDATTGTSNESGTQTEAETVTDEFITQGNIGLTSTQQLINEQRALMEFDIYDWIIQKLKVDMFLLVY